MAKQKMNMREAKKLLKNSGLKDLSNPMKMLDDISQTDLVKELKNMAVKIEDGLNINQEHILTVQKNQIEFQKYFEALYNKVKELEVKIEKLL